MCGLLSFLNFVLTVCAPPRGDYSLTRGPLEQEVAKCVTLLSLGLFQFRFAFARAFRMQMFVFNVGTLKQKVAGYTMRGPVVEFGTD